MGGGWRAVTCQWEVGGGLSVGGGRNHHQEKIFFLKYCYNARTRQVERNSYFRSQKTSNIVDG